MDWWDCGRGTEEKEPPVRDPGCCMASLIDLDHFYLAGSLSLKVQRAYRSLHHVFWVKPPLGFVSSSPADVGTGLRASVTLTLRHLPQHRLLLDVLARLRLRLEPAEFPAAAAGGGASYRVSNTATIGLSEVSLAQLVVDGVKLLVVMETRLVCGASIDDLVPAQKV